MPRAHGTEWTEDNEPEAVTDAVTSLQQVLVEMALGMIQQLQPLVPYMEVAEIREALQVIDEARPHIGMAAVHVRHILATELERRAAPVDSIPVGVMAWPQSH